MTQSDIGHLNHNNCCKTELSTQSHDGKSQTQLCAAETVLGQSLHQL